MKVLALAVLISASAAAAQTLQLQERPNNEKSTSLFVPADSSASDGIAAIRASGAEFAWSVTPVIYQSWDKSRKSLLLAIEVVGQDLHPSAAVFVIDGKSYIVQSADWALDSRHNLCALVEKEGLIRNIASASQVQVTVFAPAPLTATFTGGNLAVFREIAAVYDQDKMQTAEAPPSITPSPLVAPKAAQAEKDGKMRVTVIAKEPSTTPYDWEMNGRVSVSCDWNTCSGYYTLPSSGTQQIQGAILRLQRPDGSIAIAQCVSKVNGLATAVVALDAINAGDPNTPTVYRDCRIPSPNTVAEADFHRNKVKLSWHYTNDRHGESETYALVGILMPSAR
jgi:hypothetical protein